MKLLNERPDPPEVADLVDAIRLSNPAVGRVLHYFSKRLDRVTSELRIIGWGLAALIASMHPALAKLLTGAASSLLALWGPR